jgi:hypothetical protein
VTVTDVPTGPEVAERLVMLGTGGGGGGAEEPPPPQPVAKTTSNTAQQELAAIPFQILIRVKRDGISHLEHF